ncbi:MAG: radical SAM protein [Candidatus Cloacimonetes bacterium]|jgi:uncharacterized protein|nr:radical SAM protein [Candidatus Cloacimonadota bacterium]MCB5259465.1 radical SAM protein [Candidatus Cloacimonadota bacterium]
MLKQSFYNVWESVDEKLFLMNTYTKSVCEIDEKYSSSIRRFLADPNSNQELPPEFVSALCSNGFVVEDNVNEVKILEYAYSASMHRTDIMQIVLLQTLKCNCSCNYCFQHKDKEADMSTDMFEIFKKFLQVNLQDKRKLTLTFFGGEPLIKWSLIKDTYEWVYKLKNMYHFELETSVITNGYLLNHEVLDILINKYSINIVQVTIDGLGKVKHDTLKRLKDGSGTYDVIYANLKNMMKIIIENKSNTKIVIRLNLFNNTVNELEAFLSQFNDDEKQIIEVLCRPIFSTDAFCEKNTNILNSELFTAKAKLMGFKISDTVKIPGFYKYCEGDGGLNIFHIYPDLSIWKCGSDKSIESDKIGHINDDGYMVCNLVNLVNYLDHNPFKDDKCLSCIRLPVCYGGCPLNYLKYGKRFCHVMERSVYHMLT